MTHLRQLPKIGKSVNVNACETNNENNRRIIFYNIYLACKSLIQLDVEDQVTSFKIQLNRNDNKKL